MSGWYYGECDECSVKGPVQPFAGKPRCPDCIAVEMGQRGSPPTRRYKCSKCEEVLGNWKAVLPWGFQAECPTCGRRIKVDDEGLVREYVDQTA